MINSSLKPQNSLSNTFPLANVVNLLLIVSLYPSYIFFIFRCLIKTSIREMISWVKFLCGWKITMLPRIQMFGQKLSRAKGQVDKKNKSWERKSGRSYILIMPGLLSLFQPSGEKQEILISLSYLPSAERLTVVLLKARNLHPPPNKDTIGMLQTFHTFILSLQKVQRVMSLEILYKLCVLTSSPSVKCLTKS